MADPLKEPTLFMPSYGNGSTGLPQGVRNIFAFLLWQYDEKQQQKLNIYISCNYEHTKLLLDYNFLK